MVIEAFQKCDKSKPDGDGYDRFKKMKPFEGEFHHDFVMRLAEQLDMQVPKKDELRMHRIKNQLFQTLPEIPPFLECALRVRPLDESPAKLAKFLQNEMRLLGKPVHTKEPTKTARSPGDIPHKSFSSPDTQVVDSSTERQPQQQQVHPYLHRPGILPQDLQGSQQPMTSQNSSKQCIPNAFHQHSAVQPAQPVQHVQPTQARDNGDPAIFAAALRHNNFPPGMQNWRPKWIQYQHDQQGIQDQRRQMRRQTARNWQPRTIPEICLKCRREGHSRKDCVNSAFCTICKREGHQNRSHKKHMEIQAKYNFLF